ncbi:hypothetical protein [Burkholderia sp. WAC0059]|uniref:hypothetical protein n=1 Tax=Burkholderia sp. WAC0059 TaxID=2066022 RepID=UPI0011AF3328|nr:hypothetical protein [Burkholderia sp. WAC0059]
MKSLLIVITNAVHLDKNGALSAFPAGSSIDCQRGFGNAGKIDNSITAFAGVGSAGRDLQPPRDAAPIRLQ